MNATEALADSRAQWVAALAMPPPPQNSVSGLDALASGMIGQVLGRSPLELVPSALLRTALQPVAREKPVQLVLGAAAVGALLVWSRPWRWLHRGAVTRLLLPMIVARVLSLKAHPE